jgi:hypothetical protein
METESTVSDAFFSFFYDEGSQTSLGTGGEFDDLKAASHIGWNSSSRE